MPLFMSQVSYTREAWAALVKNPEDRRTGFSALLEKLGGRLLHTYFCFGEYDAIVIFEAPDEITASSVMLAAITPGHLKATKTTVLFTVEEAMEAMGKAGAQVYAAPEG
jgi:uncharacterized protein with GYD domain